MPNLDKFIRFWMLPYLNVEAEHYRQVRLTVTVSLIAIATSFFYIPAQYSINPIGSVISTVGTLQVIAGLFLLKWGIPYRYVAHNIAVTYFWVLTFITIITGGMNSSAIMQLSCVPIGAMMLLGKQAALFWFVVCFLEIIVLSILGYVGIDLPVWYNLEFRSALNTSGQIGALTTLFALAWAFEASKTSAQKQSEKLLLNILPKKIADRLKRGEPTIVDSFNQVSVLFADIAGFTALSTKLKPEHLVWILNRIFSSLDSIAEKYGLEKIKTIGDCYMLVGGLPEPNGRHLENMAHAALDIQKEFNRIKSAIGFSIAVRIGIHTGPAVAGVIGKTKFSYDIWGDTVNTASRMESHGIDGKIHCTEAVFRALSRNCAFEERGEIEIKGKGMMKTYFLIECQELEESVRLEQEFHH